MQCYISVAPSIYFRSYSEEVYLLYKDCIWTGVSSNNTWYFPRQLLY